jgi:hypothetical protein
MIAGVTLDDFELDGLAADRLTIGKPAADQ